MSLLHGVLALGRNHAASTFTETLEFFERGGKQIDPDTLNEADVETVLVTVSGRIKYAATSSNDSVASGQPVVAQRLTAAVPVGSTSGVAVDHFIRVTASTVDSSLVGRVYRVAGLPQSGQVTAHRYELEEVS